MHPLDTKAYALQLAKAITSDGIVTADEIKRLYEIFASFEISNDTRIEILNFVYFDTKKLAKIDIPDDISQDEELKFGLAKDVLFIAKNATNDKTQKTAELILSKLHITPMQKTFLMNWVALENDALRRLGAGESDLSDTNSFKELGARAASVGVPLTALYFAGTVGFGAVGITSGLASIGAASGLIALGLNPMAAGIAALIVAGISIKKICDFAGNSNRKKETEAALARANEIQRNFRNYLVDDMARFKSNSIRDLLAGRRDQRQLAIGHMKKLLSDNIELEQT